MKTPAHSHFLERAEFRRFLSKEQGILSCSMRCDTIEKTVFTLEYRVFLKQLARLRGDSGLTQEQIAERMGTYQRLVSRCLTGERRMDIIEVRAFCKALGISFGEFAAELDKALEQLKED